MVGARHAEAGGVPGRPPRGGAGQRGGIQARHAAATLRAARAEDGDEHDWSAVSWHEGLGREDLTSLGFLERREDLVPMGNAGTGKTHMTSAPCMMACERRMEARFFTASSLVMCLRRDRAERRAAALPGVRRPLRAAVGGHHHEPGDRPVGRGVRRRPDGGGRDRPDRPPREARPVPRRVLPCAERAHAGGASAQERCAPRACKLLKNR